MSAMPSLLCETAPLSQSELDEFCNTEESGEEPSRKFTRTNQDAEPLSDQLYTQKRKRRRLSEVHGISAETSEVFHGVHQDVKGSWTGLSQTALDSLMSSGGESPESFDRDESPMSSAMRRRKRSRMTGSDV